MQDAIDVAFENFIKILADVAAYSLTIETESDTRLKIIDRILIEVLGWTRESIKTSEQAGSGFSDYVYLIDEDARWCEVPSHRHFTGQQQVIRRLNIMRERLSKRPSGQ